MTLTAQEFAYVRDLVHREAAIVLGPGKEYLVEARLTPLARRFGLASVSEYVAQAARRLEHTQHIVEALTTNETSWFRDREPFTILANRVLPELAATRPPGQPLRLWSAACSSGQEPYTIAMVLRDAIPAGRRYEILCSDISGEMVQRTETGRYSQLEVNRGLPATMLVRHFERVGADWQISPALRQGMSYRRINIAAPLPGLPPFDVIFLRNVLIYFDLPTKRAVLRRVRELLRPGGYLFLGTAETTIGIDAEYERVEAGPTSVYRPVPLVPAPNTAASSMRFDVIAPARVRGEG
jgi:chemotaxis protein methyltransferase CheR